MEKNLHECCEEIQQEEKQINKNIDGLKEEILRELKQEKSEKKKITFASATVMTVLTILAFISFAQAVQTANIWEKIKNGAVSSAGASAGGSVNTSAPSPGSVQNLPNMVGGC